MRPIRAILVEDEEYGMETLRINIQEYCPELEIIAECTKAHKAISEINRLRPDVVFMDIHLDNMTGFDVLKSLAFNNFELVFVTVDKNFAIPAFKVDATDFLLKPVKGEELIVLANKLVRKIQAKEIASGKVTLPISTGEKYVDPNHILYLKTKTGNNKCKVILLPEVEHSDTEIDLTKTLKEMENRLAVYHFCRPNQQYLVNSQHIQEYVRTDGGFVVMTDGKAIPISKIFKESFSRCRQNWGG